MEWGGIASAGAGVIGQTLGILGVGEKRKMRNQINQQRELNKLGIESGKEMGDYNYDKQIQGLKESPTAQIEGYKAAGLNPAMMYGGGGAGGALGGGASAVSSGTADGPAATTAANASLGLMTAQMGLIAAQTKKTNAEADNIGEGGVDYENTAAGTENLKASTTATQQAIKESESRVKQIEADINSIELNNEITGRTKENQIKIKSEEAVTAALTNLVMAEQKSNIHTDTKAKEQSIKESKAKINQMAENILQGWEGLKQGDTKIAIEKWKTEVDQNYKSMGDVMGRSMDSLIERIFQMGGKQRMVREMPK